MCFKNLVLTGSNLKLFALLGSLQHLETKNQLISFTSFIGSSSGSLVAFMITLGYTVSEMKQTIIDYAKLDNFFKLNIEDALSIVETYGLDNGVKLEFLCREILQKKFPHMRDITFLELYERSAKDLIVCGSNITKMKLVYFNYLTHPNFSVIDALGISMCVPILFTPKILDGDYYVDSGVFNNFPMTYFDPKQTLGINIIDISTSTQQLTPGKMNFFLYLKMLFRAMMHNNEDTYNDYNVCNLEIIEKKFFVSLTELSLITDTDTFEDYYNQGFLQSLNFFTRLF
jgi:predicted acylesterase/phospholipase RssA